MSTLYLFVIMIVGGLLALFFAAGWGSYTQKKIPETPILFRWFLTGLIGAGISAYAWIFGAGGNPETVLETIKESFDVVATSSEKIVESVSEVPELTVGMPTF